MININNQTENKITKKQSETINNNQSMEEEDVDFNNINISFFLPKDLYDNLKEEEENDNIKNKNTINNCNKENNTSELSHLENNNNNQYENIIQKEIIPNSLSDKNINSNEKFGKNIYKDSIINNNNNNEYYSFNESCINVPNFNNENHPGIQNNIPINYNDNFFIRNNKDMPINVYFNHNYYNIKYFPNINNILTSSRIPNYSLLNQSANKNSVFYNEPSNNINSNVNNNYSINNLSKTNLVSVNLNQNNSENIDKNILKNKKVIDEYTLRMFGRKGWICSKCNNFNYNSRKKCNRCNYFKIPKRIEEYLIEENAKKMNPKNLWYCIYCGNYNYAFRLICNRCQMKKNVEM